ncbi:MAG: penicillin-binding transpeptidase domain-containing protein, partial [Fusicatenibacter sp.]|nr:penicillin-binding transpeptidase domain-containing protein [Fusicatenibacter sp.]
MSNKENPKRKTTSNGESKSRQKKASTGNGAGPYLIVAYLFVGMFVALIGYLVYFNVTMKEEYLNSSYNSRQNNYAKRVVRGSILSSDGQELAVTQSGEDGNETRVYPYGEMFAHTVGYTGKGNSGLESAYNYTLMESHINPLEQLKNDFQEKKDPGDNLITTLDTRLTQAAYDALGNYNGAVLALEPKTGRVLVDVSKPTFDPNTIEEDWESLNSDNESGVFLNRALQGQYPPGSTFKIVTALAFLREHGTLDDFSFECSGELEAGNYTIHCAGGEVHGSEDFYSAFANSCNAAFSSIGLSLDKTKFNSLADSLNLNGKLNLELPSSRSRFSIDETTADALMMQTSIGQGNTLVTPMEMALIVSAIANGGELMQPYFVDRVESSEGTKVKEYKPTSLGTVMSSEEASILTELMQGVVQNGTARSLSDLGYDIAGKTGSAEHGDNSEPTHSWFVGFSNA